jgi:signal transduction histidine kinase
MKQMRMIHEATVGVAHDLEQPLKGLEMACIELSRNPDNRELVQAMTKEFPNKVQRIYELNRAILSYSKELSKPIDVLLAPVQVADFLNLIADEFRSQTLFANIKLDILVSNPKLIIYADEKLLRRVIRNLIRNACEACSMVKNPQVVVSAQQFVALSRRVDISVSDNGPGIAPQIRERLFQPFESFGKENGTGLGLAMSKRLVEAQGGTLELDEGVYETFFTVRI